MAVPFRTVFAWRMMRHFGAFFLVPAKDHLSRRRLQHAGDGRLDGLADHLARVVDDHHRTVVQISNTLIEFLSFFQDEYLHGFARQVHRLERIRKLVDIQYLHTAELRNFVQVEIVGDNLRVQLFGQLDELHIDFANRREIVFDKLHCDPSHFLDPLKNIEPAPAAVAFQRVSRIGDLLKFAQHEVRYDEDAIQKSGLTDIGYPSVDDDTRVQDFVRFLGRTLSSEDTPECGQVQQVPFVGADDKPDIRH